MAIKSFPQRVNISFVRYLSIADIFVIEEIINYYRFINNDKNSLQWPT